MSHSIAKKVTARISVILIIALSVLFAASFFLVRDIISDNLKEQNEAMVTVYSDMVIEEAFSKNAAAFDENLAENILARGDYICRLFKIDFAYLFVPLEPGKIQYVCVSQNKKFDSINPDDKYINKIDDYTLTRDERAVWNGEKDISTSITQSKTGYEVSTMIRIQDPSGNYYMAGVDQSYNGMKREIGVLLSIITLTILLVIGLVNLCVYLIMRRSVSAPAQKVCRVMNEFLTDGERSDVKLEVEGDDEFAMISSAFNSMSADINDYLANISRLTHEQEQQDAQLNISARIQRGFLKDTYFEANRCVIHADMIPAKHIAGDLYDYLQIDDNKFLTVIADVSGKGVAASIFMAVTLMLIREFAKMDLSPAEILSKVNDTLSENNPSLLFLTAIVGIYDSDKKTYTYANAGHNLPYILNSRVTPLAGEQNVLLGLFPGEVFTENTVKLETGDTLFLYTDGVNEAVNADKQFFGTGRLEAALRDFITAKKENPVDFVNQKVADFVGDAERHDDITMLCFSPAETEHLVLEAEEPAFETLKNKILSLPIPRKEQLNLCLAAEEIFMNICAYSYPEQSRKGQVRVLIALSNRVTLRFTDTGIPFNPTRDPINPDEYDVDTQIGGLGRFIAFNQVDDAEYEYKNGKNILTLTKYII